ncbi:MAG TPA: cytochrome c oxidase subunit II [Acidisarcina sp.]|nr:cytochrome c oxidase subunit II [Acidisarcina sp.]
MLAKGLQVTRAILRGAMFLPLLACQRALAASSTSIFAPGSTPAKSIVDLSIFVIALTGTIFVVVASLLVYVIVRYHHRRMDDESEPPQIYGSSQVEMAWTVVPVLIVVVLFLTTARVIFGIQDARKPKNAVDVTVIGHQFWWEFRYPKQGIVTANELHVPVSDAHDPSPTFLTLLSADVDHSFWVPELAGKTDLIPNHPNSMWIDPHTAGVYLGQCAQFCGTQHAKMLLRVVVQPKAEFEQWVRDQKAVAQQSDAVAAGRHVFETQACINCHTISGTVGTGRFGPDLSHLMSRATLAAGAVPNTPQDLRQWIREPDSIKPGSLMPAMNLSDQQLDQLTAYLSTLR